MKRFIQIALIVIWLVILLTPIVVFLHYHTWSALDKPSTAFPLFGLIAFTLIWSQIIIGSFMRPLERLYPNIFRLHIYQGIFALILVHFHPFLLFVSLSLKDKIAHLMFQENFVAPSLELYVYLGELMAILVTIGVLAGLLRNWEPVKRYWHWTHLINYIVFFGIFIHSRALGTDVVTFPILNDLWWFFFVTVVIGILYRRVYIPMRYGLQATTQ